MKRKIITAVMLMAFALCLIGTADTTSEAAGKGKYFLAGSIYYHTLSGNKVEVCGTKVNKGTLTIPASVTYKGKKYKVTQIADHKVYDQSGSTGNEGNELNIYTGAGVNYRYDRVDKKEIPGGVNTLPGSRFNKVVLPDTITYIGDGAFNGCSKLKTVSFAKKYKKLTIGENVFGGTKLKSITFPKGTCELKNSAAGDVATVNIPASVKKIGAGVVDSSTKKVVVDKKNKDFKVKDGMLYSKNEEVLYGCSAGVEGEVIISAATTTIMDKAFCNAKVTAVTLNDKITEIPEGAFNGCAELVTVKGTDNVTSIKRGAFAGCAKLTDIGSLGKLESIGFGAFWQDACLNLEIGATVKEVSDYAFSGTVNGTALKSVKIADGNKLLSVADGLLIKTEGETKTVIMQTGDAEKIAVPEGVTNIAVCLGGNVCKEIKLPATLKVQDGRLTTNEGSVTFAGSAVPQYGADFGVNEKTTVYVPQSKLSEFRDAMDKVVEKRDDLKLFDDKSGPMIKGY